MGQGEDRTCSAPDCFRAAFRKGLCVGHLKRHQRGQDIEAPIGRPTWDCLHEAILAYALSDTDADYERNKAALVSVLRRWALARCPPWSTGGGKMRSAR